MKTKTTRTYWHQGERGNRKSENLLFRKSNETNLFNHSIIIPTALKQLRIFIAK